MRPSFFAVALSFAGACFAAPATESPKWPYSIGDLSLKHLIESDTFDLVWTVTSRGPTGDDLGSTTCHTAWNNGSIPNGPKNPEACVDTAYKYWFPTGASDLESFEIVIEGPEGSAITTIEAGPKYQCGPYTGTIGNIDKECKTTNGGEFYLHQ
ncbi:hypothetical protein N7541_007181 [Penicillium brevicompactum]|uniref:AA1-like domain-containing protein n=1 Tax=Penicillium brevicompactum TaxID=5074 RepID=A0A9W9QZ09_PENBR|nr:hypothetical protein N7541_007181 [Penicillium brevicompactum]